MKGLYAGVRDSALTSHGVHQADRLGQHFADAGLRFTNIFSSNLSRAVKTAECIRVAQHDPSGPEVMQTATLREQDFGYYEGKPFHARSTQSQKSGKEIHRREHLQDPDFQDVESKDSMKLRAEEFLSEYLRPVMKNASVDISCVVAVVSHGILLSSLWRCLLSTQPSESVNLAPNALSSGPPPSLEYLGGWSNTGYMELHYYPPTPGDGWTLVKEGDRHTNNVDWVMEIVAVNKKTHLTGLKRTRGGLGSAQHDESQKSIEGFFKKRRVDAS